MHLSIARVYISVFGTDNKEDLLKKINNQSYLIRKKLGERIRNQMRKVPELKFFLTIRLIIQDKLKIY